MTYDYLALGLDIASPFPCAGFWAVDRAVTGRNVELDLGSVPLRLDDPVRERPLLQVARDGTVLHRVPGVARYLVHGRTRLTIELEVGGSLARAVEFLKGTPMAVLCQRWGLVPLDATALSIDGMTLLLGGSAASGKTTMGLALARRHGFRLMADELCALESRPDATPLVWPAFPEVRLWKDSLQALDQALPPGGPNPGGRYTVGAADWFDPEPRPATTLVAVHPARGGTADRTSKRRGSAAFELVMNLQRLPDALRGLVETNPIHVMAALAAKASIFEVFYPNGLDRAAALPEWLLSQIGFPLEPGCEGSVGRCA